MRLDVYKIIYMMLCSGLLFWIYMQIIIESTSVQDKNTLTRSGQPQRLHKHLYMESRKLRQTIEDVGDTEKSSELIEMGVNDQEIIIETVNAFQSHYSNKHHQQQEQQQQQQQQQQQHEKQQQQQQQQHQQQQKQQQQYNHKQDQHPDQLIEDTKQISNPKLNTVTKAHDISERQPKEDLVPVYNISTRSRDQCKSAQNNIVFIKTHKAASSTVSSILKRYGFERNLSFVLPLLSYERLGWPLKLQPAFHLPSILICSHHFICIYYKLQGLIHNSTTQR